MTFQQLEATFCTFFVYYSDFILIAKIGIAPATYSFVVNFDYRFKVTVTVNHKGQSRSPQTTKENAK